MSEKAGLSLRLAKRFARALLAASVMAAVLASPARAETEPETACDGRSADGLPADPLAPPTAEGPVPVDFGLYLVEIAGIEPVDGEFLVEAVLDLVWCDPRLAFDPAEAGTRRRVYAGAVNRLDEIWWPEPDLANGEGTREVHYRDLAVSADGTAEYRERFAARLSADFDLRAFPLDRQVLEIRVDSPIWPEDVLTFQPKEGSVRIAEGLELPEWHIEGVRSRSEAVREDGERELSSEVVLELEVARRPGYYLGKVLLPLVLLVMVSWSAFWISGADLADRLGISLTAILTVVAYQFIITDDLPKVPYFTGADRLLLLSFLLLVLTVAQNVVSHRLDRHGRAEASERLDRSSRWTFPLVYAVGIAAISFLALAV